MCLRLQWNSQMAPPNSLALENSAPQEVGQVEVPESESLPETNVVEAPSSDQVHSPKKLPGSSRTDSGNAELFAYIYENLVLFDHKQQRWLIWDGRKSRWCEDKTGRVRELTKAVARMRAQVALNRPSLTEHQRAEQKAEIAWALQSQSLYRINAASELAKSAPRIADPGDGWNEDPWLFGVENGVVDLRTGNLRVGTQENRITKFSPVIFDSNAGCPRFQQFLTEVFDGDSALISYVQTAVGYTLTGLTQEQCFFACHGTGRNGKSTFFEIIMYIMGDYGTDLPFNVLEKKQQIPVGEGTNLPGARFAKCVEMREDLQLDEARMKSWTGGDTVTINPKFRPPFSFTPTHKLWLAFNHKPRVTDDSEAMWRRFRMIPFNHTFNTSQADKGLLEKLKAEAPGILNWAIAGCLAWQRDGFRTPSAVERATNEYERESDLLAPFFADCCEFGNTFRAPKCDLREAYEHWCARNKETPFNRNIFAEKLRDRGFKEGSTGMVRYWTGLRLRTTDATDATTGCSGDLPIEKNRQKTNPKQPQVVSGTSAPPSRDIRQELGEENPPQE
jgi:putative DNA primase/helicase